MNYSINRNTVTINGLDVTIENIIFTNYLGEGANSVVFRGYDELLDRHLAIKIYFTKAEDDRDKYKQALREAQKIASLKHRNIVDIFRANSHHNTIISIEMELVEGRTLRAYLESSDTEIDLSHKIWHQLYEALSYSYQQGIYHGDLHDRNILIVDDINIKVIDFGTSLFARNERASEQRDSRLLLRLFNKMFGKEYSILIDNHDSIDDKPEIILNITKTILLIFDRIKALEYYYSVNSFHLAEQAAGNISVCIAGCPFINISNVISNMLRRGIDEHYINVFLNGCINTLKLVLSNTPHKGIKGFHYDKTTIGDLTINVNNLLIEARELHKLLYQEDRINYLSNVG